MAKHKMKIYSFGMKMEFYPNRKQRKYLFNNIHTSRYIYNQLVTNSFTDSKIHKLNKQYPIPKTYWQYNKKHKVIKISQNRPTKLRRVLQNKPIWMTQEVLDSDMFRNTEKQYQAAWNMYRKVKNTGTPKFKSRNKCSWSYTTSNHYAISMLRKKNEYPTIYNGSIRFIDSKHLYAGRNLGILVLHYGQSLPKQKHLRISNVTFRYEKDGHWFVSILFKNISPFRQSLPKNGKQVGIDLNISNFMMDSNGNKIANPHYYKNAKNRLAKLQRILSRRERRAKKAGRSLRDSKNYQKQRKLVAKLHRHIKNQRKNFTNQLSTALIKNHDLVVSENLQSKNLMKNHAVAQSVADVGWRQLISQLKYKANLYDRTYILVNPAYTTQICHDCGYRMGSDNRSHKLCLNDRYWVCPNCHRLHIRDLNAAKNILAKGLNKYDYVPLHTVNVYD